MKRRNLSQTVASGWMGVWRRVVARASGIGEVSLGVLLLVVVAGLMFGATCGAPDEVMRGQAQITGGSGGAFSSSSSSGGTTGIAGSSASTKPTGGSVGPGGAGSSGSPGGTSSAGGTSASGGTTTAGGSGGTGGISSPGGTGGKGTGGKGSGGAGTGGKGSGGAGTGGVATGGSVSTGGSGGTTSPFGGTTAIGGTATGGVNTGGVGSGGVVTGGSTVVTTGGTGGSGGKGGTAGSTSTAPPPTGLDVSLTKPVAGATGQISLFLIIENQGSAAADLTNVTLRYWYKDDGWDTSTLAIAVDYASLSGDTVTGGKSVAAARSTAADHYLEFSFTGTIPAKSQFQTNFRLHNSNWAGTVDVTNDYSYNGGVTGLNDKMTLYASGKLIWGTEP